MSNNENPNPVPNTTFIMSDSVYAKLKFAALVLLPALSTLYFTLGSVWGLPAVTQVIGTIAAIDTFLGVLLGISTKAYNASDARYDGSIAISNTADGGKLYSLELKSEPEALDQKDAVTFRVDS
jgi:hypothetical protein